RRSFAAPERSPFAALSTGLGNALSALVLRSIPSGRAHELGALLVLAAREHRLPLPGDQRVDRGLLTFWHLRPAVACAFVRRSAGLFRRRSRRSLRRLSRQHTRITGLRR